MIIEIAIRHDNAHDNEIHQDQYGGQFFQLNAIYT